MAKLIITIEEKAEQVEGDRTLVGFGVTQDMDFEGADKSLLPSMGPLLTNLVMRAIEAIQKCEGATLHKAATSDRSIPLDHHMAEMKAEINQPFPTEL